MRIQLIIIIKVENCHTCMTHIRVFSIKKFGYFEYENGYGYYPFCYFILTEFNNKHLTRQTFF